jgi:tetratricopeptide (TPR) repeat protein
VEHTLKTISTSGIDEAISKIQLYRYLNEPEEAESICQDILAADPENQLAIRYLGLAITDQFAGSTRDRHTESENAFQRLTDPYERLYYLGLLLERRAKTQMRAGVPARAWIPLINNAMRDFEEAEKIRPAGNDDAILRWNRCVRILQNLPHVVSEQPEEFIGDDESVPVNSPRSSRAAR